MKEEAKYANKRSIYPDKVVIEDGGYKVEIKLEHITKKFKYEFHQGGDAYGTIIVASNGYEVKRRGNLVGNGNDSATVHDVGNEWESKYNEKMPSLVCGLVNMARERYDSTWKFDENRERKKGE